MNSIQCNKQKRTYAGKIIIMLAAALLQSIWVMARDGGNAAPKESSIYDPFVLAIVLVMLLLLLVIGLLANIVIGAATYKYEKEKEQNRQKNSGAASVVATVIGLLLFTTPVFAQETTAVQQPVTFNGLSETAFYFLMGVLMVEVIVIFSLLYYLRVFLAKEKLQQAATSIEYKAKPRQSIWHKLNKFRPIEQEANIDLGHDYDGIRELDNRLPPWWLYGFYITIVFAGIYLWRYHVTHSAPSSEQEYVAAMKLADEQKVAYLARAANNVDENTVTLLSDAPAITAGQTVFNQNCAACHGKAGEGTVGPNLTDDYWLHGGGVKDIFKTIKYGWPEKGMRSWKEDLSPVQIAQVTSYIKSLHGTNPPNGKEKQGELYKEETPVPNKPDSVSNKLAQNQ